MRLNILGHHLKHTKAVHLSAAFVLFWVPVLIFAKITNEMVEKDTISYDSAILHWIHSYSSSFLDALFYFFTSLGNVASIIIVTAAIVTWLIYKKH
jgi:hypothetical protein